jgi:hypothetical protein
MTRSYSQEGIESDQIFTAAPFRIAVYVCELANTTERDLLFMEKLYFPLI